mgnify:CR=1 FL=1
MRNTLLALAMMASAPLAAHAADPLNYSYAEAGYTHLDADANAFGSLKLNGGYLRGAWAITDSVQVFGSYARVADSTRAGTITGQIDMDQLTLGAGWQTLLSERVYFTSDLAWVRLSQSESIGGFSADSGYQHLNGNWDDSLNAGRFNVGLRGKPSARSEAWIKAGVMDGSSMDGAFVGTLGGQFNITATWGIVSQAQWTGDHVHYTTGIRAHF